MRKRLMLLSMAGMLALSACAQSPNTPAMSANPYPPPPPVLDEARPKPPVTEDELLWQPGYWDWTGSGYVWRHGEYVKRAGHGSEWQEGYWTNTSGKWEWDRAHWL